MKSLKYTLLALLCAGCASFNANTFNSTKLAVDTTYGAVHAWNTYYSTAKSTATPQELQLLEIRKGQIYTASKNVGQVAATAEKLRLEYLNNKQETNKTALLIALHTLENQSSNITAIVQIFMKERLN